MVFLISSMAFFFSSTARPLSARASRISCNSLPDLWISPSIRSTFACLKPWAWRIFSTFMFHAEQLFRASVSRRRFSSNSFWKTRIFSWVSFSRSSLFFSSPATSSLPFFISRTCFSRSATSLRRSATPSSSSSIRSLDWEMLRRAVFCSMDFF